MLKAVFTTCLKTANNLVLLLFLVGEREATENNQTEKPDQRERGEEQKPKSGKHRLMKAIRLIRLAYFLIL